MESVKMKKATKTVAFRQLAIYCNIVDNQLLTDAETREYGGEDGGGGDGAGYGG